MAKKTLPKTLRKKTVKKTAGRAAVSGKKVRLQKLFDILASRKPAGDSPCRAALDRVRGVLSVAEKAELATDLLLLDKAVAGCPGNCGCANGLKRVVISNNGRILGEMTSEGGKFSGLFLNGAGEDLLGEEISRLRYVGLKDVPGYAAPVQVRDPEFLGAFVGWCGVHGCEAMVLAEPYLPVWSKLQASNLDEEEVLLLMDRLRDIDQDEALRLIEGLSSRSGDWKYAE